MDGSFAVLMFIIGLWDMNKNYCPDQGCLTRHQVQAYNAVSAGNVFFNGDNVGNEIYIRRNTGLANGPFQTIYGLSATDTNDYWVGIGHAYTWTNAQDNFFVQLHAMPGIYSRGSGKDLGGPIEFRSGIEVGYQARNGVRYGLSLDHRSNAEIYSKNSGLETLQFRVSIPTN